MKAIVLTIPHSGTHFTMRLLQLLKVEAEYTHFQKSWEHVIRERLENIRDDERLILPFRPRANIKQTWINRINAKGADWFGTRQDEYEECWDVRCNLMSLMSEIGFYVLPIVKSPLRWDHLDALEKWLESPALSSSSAKALHEYVEEWGRVRSWDNEKGVYRDDGILMPQRKKAMKLLTEEKELRNVS